MVSFAGCPSLAAFCGLCIRFAAHALDQRIQLVPIDGTYAHGIVSAAGNASDFLNITCIVGYIYLVVARRDRHGIHSRLFFRFRCVLAICVESDKDLFVGHQDSRALHPWATRCHISDRTSQCITVYINLIRVVCSAEYVAIGRGIAHMRHSITRRSHGTHACPISRVLVNGLVSRAIGEGGVRTGSIGVGVEVIVASICSEAAEAIVASIVPEAAEAIVASIGSEAAEAIVASIGSEAEETIVASIVPEAAEAISQPGARGASARIPGGAIGAGSCASVISEPSCPSPKPSGIGSVVCSIHRAGTCAKSGASAYSIVVADMKTIHACHVSCRLGSGLVRRRVVRSCVVTTCGSDQSDTCDCWNEPFLIHWNTSYTIECPHCDRRFRGNFSSYCLKYDKMVVVCTSEEGADLIRTQAGTYEVMEENRDGWNPEAFKERYSDILDKYDYIVGDWGYGQLRLRGFYSDANRKVPFEQRISALDEYLQEFCNFGCPYFVLQKVKGAIGSDDNQSQDLAAYDAEGEERQELVRDDVIHTERKDRRRYHPRQNKQDRQERGNATATQEQRVGSSRSERSDKPRLNKDKMEKGRDNGKDRRPNQPRSSRERDKVSSSPNPNPPKRDV